jgi:hypothetical protein
MCSRTLDFIVLKSSSNMYIAGFNIDHVDKIDTYTTFVIFFVGY